MLSHMAIAYFVSVSVPRGELDVFVSIVGIHKGEGDVRCEM